MPYNQRLKLAKMAMLNLTAKGMEWPCAHYRATMVYNVDADELQEWFEQLTN